MDLLILGGTRFVGRHLAAAALARGYRLTLFTRGRTEPGLFAQAEHLRGDRDGGLAALAGRRWDAVIDTCGYLPRVVRQSAQLLRGAVDRYLFVSSISVYERFFAGLDEAAPRARLIDPGSEDVVRDYGALKAACEDVVLDEFAQRALLLRPGLIVGPFDPTGRFTYWPLRLARGGDVLAPEAPTYPVQFIDARDLAEFALHALEGEAMGAFNVTGPAQPATLDGVLEDIATALGAAPRLHWVSGSFLAEHGVAPWTELPLWAGEDMRSLGEVSIARAVSAGLLHRPLADTARDTLAWAQHWSGTPQSHGLAPEREAELLRLLVG